MAVMTLESLFNVTRTDFHLPRGVDVTLPMLGGTPDFGWYDAPMAADQISDEVPELAKRGRQGQSSKLIRFMMIIALGAVVVMGFMTIKTYRTDQQIGTLRTSGTEVTYELTTCASACTGSFDYHGRTYTEDLQGILNSPSDHSKVAAMIDPENPGSYVYVRSAVFGPNAAGRGAWYTGLIVVLVLAISMIAAVAVLAARSRRDETQIARD